MKINVITTSFREQAHINLLAFQETSRMEKKQRGLRMYMAEYKFKNDLESCEFLQRKRKLFKIIVSYSNLNITVKGKQFYTYYYC